MVTCPRCEKGKLVKELLNGSMYGVELRNLPILVCNECNEQWFDEDVAKKLIGG